MKLLPNHPALLLFDNFKAQCTGTLLTHIDAHNVYVVLIPANCTDRLQPLDISVNKPAKDFLHKQFQQWYSAKVCCQFQVDPKEPVNLRSTILKPWEQSG